MKKFTMKRSLMFLVICLGIFFAGCSSNQAENSRNNMTTPNPRMSNADNLKLNGDKLNEDIDNMSNQITKNEKGVVYSPDNTGEKLVRKDVNLDIIQTMSRQSKAKALIEKLVSGDEEVKSTMPSNTKVLSVVEKDKMMVVDLSKDFMNDPNDGSMNVNMKLGSIVMTLTELEDINSVKILIDGKEGEELAGLYVLDTPFTRDEFEKLTK